MKDSVVANIFYKKAVTKTQMKFHKMFELNAVAAFVSVCEAEGDMVVAAMGWHFDA